MLCIKKLHLWAKNNGVLLDCKRLKLSLWLNGYVQYQPQIWVEGWQGAPHFSLQIYNLATLTLSPGPFGCSYHFSFFLLFFSVVDSGLLCSLFSPASCLRCPLTAVPFTAHTHTHTLLQRHGSNNTGTVACPHFTHHSVMWTLAWLLSLF